MDGVTTAESGVDESDVNESDFNESDVNKSDVNKSDVNESDINESDVNESDVNESDVNESDVNDDSDDIDDDEIDDDEGKDETLNSITESNKENEHVFEKGSTEEIKTEEIKKKPRAKKPKVIINKDKKIGPQKQKEVIRNLLKRSRIYEIRKLTRRIERLRSSKGNEKQLEKNKRKVVNFLKEIEAMKGLIIENMAEKLVDVFKGFCNDFCKDIWNAALSKTETEKKLQKLGDKNFENKFIEIAYLKIFSSKDVVEKLKLIENGRNLKKPHKKPRKLKRKPSKKHILKNNSEPNSFPNSSASSESTLIPLEILSTKSMESNIIDFKSKIPNNKPNSSLDYLASSESASTYPRTLSTKSMDSKITDFKSKVPNEPNLRNKLTGNNLKKYTNQKVTNKKPSNQKLTNNKPTNNKPGDISNVLFAKAKENTKIQQDSFFLNKPSTSLNDIDEEFNAPSVVLDNVAVKSKRNRMGQRTRQKLYQEKSGVKTYNEKSGFNSNREKFRIKSYKGFEKDFKHPKIRHKEFNQLKRKTNKIDDIESLHPSWQAKKKMKLNPVAFSGTRITFAD